MIIGYRYIIRLCNIRQLRLARLENMPTPVSKNKIELLWYYSPIS
jgi:hypothetical protein